MQMKTRFLSLIAASLIIGVAIVSVISCSKTDQEKVNQKGTITHFSPEKSMVEPTITKFIQRFEDYKAGYKTGGEDIKLGEAVWTLEAGVNYEFQSPKEDMGDFTTDSLSITVDVYVGNDNEYYITEADAMNLYGEMLSFTGNQVSSEDVELFVADLEVKSVENGQAEMKISSTGGKGGFNYYEINNTDYWYPVANMGKCGNYAPQYAGIKDASDRIREILNHAQVEADYWTDVETFYLIYNYFYPCEDGECFWEGSNTDCLDPDAMEHWNVQAQGVIQELKPEGKSRIEANFGWGVWTGTLYYHYFDYISYGIPHSNGGGH